MILTKVKVDNVFVNGTKHMYLLEHSKIHNVYVTFKVGNTTCLYIYMDKSSPH